MTDDVVLLAGDCLNRLRELDPESIDSVVADPPYGINFMGKEWDGAAIEEAAQRERESRREMPPRLTGSLESPSRKLVPRTGSAFANRAGEAGAYDFTIRGNRAFQAWCELWGAELLRVLKPGGYALVFGGCRTHHRLTCALEEVGFEIRDELCWLFGSGFPKSADPLLGMRSLPRSTTREAYRAWHRTVRTTATGTALKPAHEPIVVARKPLRGTVAANVLEHGTGALNIDGCRIEGPASVGGDRSGSSVLGVINDDGWQPQPQEIDRSMAAGRWPANVVLAHTEDCVQVGSKEVVSDGHYPAARPGGVEIGAVGHVGQEGLKERHTRGETVEVWECAPGCPVRLLDEQTGELAAGVAVRHHSGGRTFGGDVAKPPMDDLGYGDSGGASRFFYVAKASRAERNAGLGGFEASISVRTPMAGRGQGGLKCRACGKWKASGSPCVCADPDFEQVAFDRPATANHHPTVKPIQLMRWLVRLVTPPDGLILDPFLGSGTTGITAVLEGFRFVGIEREPDYMRIAEARIAFWREHGEEGLRVVAERDAADRKRQETAVSGQLDLLAAASIDVGSES